MAQRNQIRKGFHTTCGFLTPSAVPGQVFEYMGRVCKRYLERYWSDLALDYEYLKADVADMTTEVLEKNESVMRRFAWIVRDSGTHMYNVEEKIGLDGLAAVGKTWGTNNVRCEIILTAKPDVSDAEKVVFEYHFTINNIPKKEAE